MAQIVNQSFLDNDSYIQSVLNDKSRNAGNVWFSGVGVEDDIKKYLASKGLQLPDGYGVTGTGQLRYNDPVDWKKIALIGGAAVAAPIVGPLATAGAVSKAAQTNQPEPSAPSGPGTVGSNSIVQGDGGPGGGVQIGPDGSILDKASTIGRTLSPILGGAAKGAQEGQQSNDLLKLRGAQLGLEAPQQRLNTSVRASIAANAKPIQITTGPSPFAHAPAGSTMPHFTNSLSPALLDPGTRQLAQSIIAQQLQEQMSPNHGLPDVGNGSTAGNILGGAALGSSILGSLGTLRGHGTSSPINVSGNYNPSDYVGINPDTGLWDPNFDPNAGSIPEVPIDWSNVGTDTTGSL